MPAKVNGAIVKKRIKPFRSVALSAGPS